MHHLWRSLRARERPVAVGVVGAGEFGTRTVESLARVPGLHPAVVADVDVDAARDALRSAGVETTADAAGIDDALAGGRPVATGPEPFVERAGALDVVVEATGVPDAGARHAYEAIDAGTHVVMATVEADAVVGPWLAGFAADCGVAYAPAHGDQPALVADLCGWARIAGLDVVAAGRGTTSMDTNAAIEACVAANATGLPPDPGGMHAPAVALSDVPNRLRPRADGGVLDSTGVIETVVAPDDAVPGGAFVVVTHPDGSVRDFLAAKNPAAAHASDDGDYLAFWRRHHLPGVETTVTVARAALGRATAGGDPGAGAASGADAVADSTGTHVADVVAVADEPFAPGETLSPTYPASDRFTGRLVRAGAGGVPLPLLDGAEVVEPVAAGEVITHDGVALTDSFLSRLRGLQDALSSTHG